MEENTIQFTMRMDKDLYEKLKESAKKNKRSIAKELEFITESFLTSSYPIMLPKEIAKKFLNFLFGSNDKDDEYKIYREMLKDEDFSEPFINSVSKKSDTDSKSA